MMDVEHAKLIEKQNKKLDHIAVAAYKIADALEIIAAKVSKPKKAKKDKDKG